MVVLRSLGVFCGSSSGNRPVYEDVTRELGELLASEGIGLVYGGARVGLMGTLADSCMAAGGEVTGVIPSGVLIREIGHRKVDHLYEVSSMHERKELLYDLSDGFLGLPGGFGTLEELAEVATWTQLGLHRKPIVLLDVDGFWGPLIAQLDRMVAEGFLRIQNREVVQRSESPRDAIERIRTTEPAYVEKWITPEER